MGQFSMTISAVAGSVLGDNQHMDEATAHSLAASLVKNIDEVRAVHKSMQALDPALLSKPSVVEFHPGAAKAYSEAGLSQ